MTRAAIMAMVMLAQPVSAGPAPAGDVAMTLTCIRHHDYAANDIAPGPADAEDVARVWNRPIPADWQPLGGIDWYGWGRACHHAGDPPDILRGGYRDRLINYEGTFRLRYPDGTPAPFSAAKGFRLNYYDASRGLILDTDGPPPVRFLILEFADPAAIEQAPPQAVP
jgi:hypothetical protein